MNWVERVTRVRRWTRGQERAPHKPLLLLYALGHYQRLGGTPIVYSAVEEHLGRLLREFGPPRSTSPAYPFHHLTSDGLWEVRTSDGGDSPGARGGALRASGAAGRLTQALVDDLQREPQLLSQLGRAILDTNFAPSLHEDICVEVGLDLEAIDTATGAEGRRRSREFRQQVMVAYEYRCAFCGYDGWLGGAAVGLDAAHVQWFAHGGPDEVANGICLCALHHKLLDKGVLGMTAGWVITVSAHYVGRAAAAHSQVIALAGREVGRPQSAFPSIGDQHIAWHGREVFRAPARVA